MGQNPLDAYRKKRFRLDILIWTLSVFVILGWAINLDTTENISTTKVEHKEQNVVNEKPKYACPQNYLDKNDDDYCAENQVVEVLNWRVSSKEVSRVNSYMGRELCFKVRLDNLDEEARDFAESDFRLRWPSGQVHDLWTDFSVSGTLDSAPLASGGYASGKVCFKDPRETGEYMLIFKPSLDSERGIWFYNLSGN